VRSELGAAGRRTRAPGIGDEYIFDVLESASIEAGSGERDRRVPAGPPLHVGEIEQPVALEIRMHQDRVQAARLELLIGPARYRRRVELAVADDPKTARQLGDQHIAAVR